MLSVSAEFLPNFLRVLALMKKKHVDLETKEMNLLRDTGSPGHNPDGIFSPLLLIFIIFEIFF